MLNFNAYKTICDLFESIHFSMINGPVTVFPLLNATAFI